MLQSHIIGHDTILNFLDTSLKTDRLSHTYIFNGQRGLGKMTIAKYFATKLICKNQNIFVYPPVQRSANDCQLCESIMVGVNLDTMILTKAEDKKNISINEIRELSLSLVTKPVLGQYKVAIIDDADSLSLEASNAFLKTLEEPYPYIIIILLTSKLRFLPSTVISRAQVINFYPVSIDKIYGFLIKNNFSPDDALNIASLSLGSPSKIMPYIGDPSKFDQYKDNSFKMLGILTASLSDRFQISDSLLGFKGLGFNEALSNTQLFLDTLLLILRDVILLQNHNHQAVSHRFMLEQLERVAKVFPMFKVGILIRKIEQAKRDLYSNVLPSLVVENILISF